MKLLSSMPNVDAATGNQDVGVMRDDVTPGDGTGTPVREDKENDVYYALRAIMNLASLTPDNSVEGVTASQVADALQDIVNGVTGQRNNVATNYTILDGDFFHDILVDSTAGDITIILPLLANNIGRRIRIVHVKSAGTPNKIIIAPNATDTNSLTNDGLAVMWLPKVGDHIEFVNNDTTGALLWQGINERMSGQLRLDTYAGYGSSDNKIVQFTNSVENFGNLFSHNHGSYGTAGLEITINRSGKYAFVFGQSSPTGSASDRIGLSLNSTQLTTDILSITLSDRLIMQGQQDLAGTFTSKFACYWSGYLNNGDIVRPHTFGLIPSVSAHSTFTASYLGN